MWMLCSRYSLKMLTRNKTIIFRIFWFEFYYRFEFMIQFYQRTFYSHLGFPFNSIKHQDNVLILRDIDIKAILVKEDIKFRFYKKNLAVPIDTKKLGWIILEIDSNATQNFVKCYSCVLNLKSRFLLFRAIKCTRRT